MSNPQFKLDPVVRQETRRIFWGTLFLSCITQIIFILLGRWDYKVLLGGLLGGGWAVLNFLLMGITVQNSVGQEELAAHRKIQNSYMVRSVITCGVVVLSAAVSWFNWIPAVAGIFFPRILIAVFSIFRRDYGQEVKNPLPVAEEEEEDDGDELERMMDKVYGARVDYTDALAKKEPDTALEKQPQLHQPDVAASAAAPQTTDGKPS